MSNRAKYWARLVASWRKSALTQAEFCRAHSKPVHPEKSIQVS